MTICSSFSLKNFASTKEEIIGGNHWVPQYLEIPISHNFEYNLRKVHDMFKQIMGSASLIGMKRVLDILNSLPFNLAKLTVDRISRQISMSYSNMPTTKTNWEFNGSTVTSISAFLPAVGDMLGGFVAISHGNSLSISLITDTHYIQYPDEFMSLFKNNVKRFIDGNIMG